MSLQGFVDKHWLVWLVILAVWLFSKGFPGKFLPRPDHCPFLWTMLSLLQGWFQEPFPRPGLNSDWGGPLLSHLGFRGNTGLLTHENEGLLGTEVRNPSFFLFHPCYPLNNVFTCSVCSFSLVIGTCVLRIKQRLATVRTACWSVRNAQFCGNRLCHYISEVVSIKWPRLLEMAFIQSPKPEDHFPT